jgi:hypothetical protein
MIAQKNNATRKRVKRNLSQAGIVRVLKEKWELMKGSKGMYDTHGMSRRVTNFNRLAQRTCDALAAKYDCELLNPGLFAALT